LQAFLDAIRTVLTDNGAALAGQPRYHAACQIPVVVAISLRVYAGSATSTTSLRSRTTRGPTAKPSA
jgi:hypothetical protein